MNRCTIKRFFTVMMLLAATHALPVLAGDLEPPANAVDANGDPVSTMKTLDEIPPTWSQKLPASERFELVLDGEAVLDKETGLVWAKNANIAAETQTWQSAMNYCRYLGIAGRKGWRLPSVEELASLVDTAQSGPALPSGHPFVNVLGGYWSSTAYERDSTGAWYVNLYNGSAFYCGKDDTRYVWPVRGGN